MVKANRVEWTPSEALLAELTTAAYRVRRTLGVEVPEVRPLESGEADGFEEAV